MSLKIYYGWVVVAASFTVLTAAYSLLFSYGVFLPHITLDLGLDHATAAAPFSLCILVYSVLSCLTGPLSDRVGCRALLLAGGTLLGAGYLFLGSATRSWQIFLSLGVIVGIGMSAAFVPLNAAIVKWFVRRRGLALALAGTGFSTGALFGPLLATVLVLWSGWRTALVALGLSGGAMIVLSALLFVRDSGTGAVRRDPRVTDCATDRPAHGISDARSWTLEEARRQSALWIILLVFFLNWIVLLLPYLYLPPLAIGLGYDPKSAAALVSALGLGGLLGRMVVGWSSDFVGRIPCLHAALGAQALACMVLAGIDALPLLYLAAVTFGIGASSGVTLFPAVVGDLFGRLHVGAISGFIFAIASGAGAFGPYLAGLIRDAAGTYQTAFLIGAAFNAIAIVLAAALKPPQRA